MALIEWNSKLSVSVPEFDEEHKKLIGMINSLHEAMKTGKGKDLLANILDECTEYALKHFAHEEKLMVQYKYPDYKGHKEVHDAFVNKIVELRAMHNRQALQSRDLQKILQEWLVNHINTVDKRYASFFVETMNK